MSSICKFMQLIAMARGLLLILNNIEWVACHANYRLLNLYKSLGYVSVDRLQTTLNEAWEKGRKDISSRYVKLRSEWLCLPLESYLLDDLPSQKRMVTKMTEDINAITGNFTSNHILSHKEFTQSSSVSIFSTLVIY
ncbi:unnamed protein product [Trichobilharzia regenti]|nr:unnamed protein product [Trichobilharzia regenti]